MARDITLEEKQLRGPESKTELVRDQHDPSLTLVDRVADFSGGVNFRDYQLVEDNQCIELQNGYPADTFSGRKGYIKYNSTAITSANRISNITRYYKAKTDQILVLIADLAAGDEVYYGGDNDGSMTEITGHTALDGAQEDYSFITYKDELFWSSLGQGIQYWSGSGSSADCGGTLPANNCSLLAVHEDRMWAAGATDAANTVYYSAAGVHSGDPSSDMDFDGGGSINVSQGDGDYIIAMVPFYKILWLFKRNYAVQIIGNSRFTFSANYPPINRGAVGPKAICKGGYLLYFVSWDGVYTLDAAGSLECVSSNIEPIFRQQADPSTWNVNKTFIHRSVLFSHDNYIWLSYPSGASEWPDKVLIYDPLRKGWYPQKGMDINCAVSQRGYGDEYELRAASTSAGTVWKMLEGYDDNGSDIEFVCKPKHRDQKMPERYKEYMSLITDLITEKAATITVLILVDDSTAQESTTATTAAGVPWGSFLWGARTWSAAVSLVDDTIPLNQEMRGKKITARYSLSSSTDRLTLRSCTFTAKPEMLRR